MSHQSLLFSSRPPFNDDPQRVALYASRPPFSDDPKPWRPLTRGERYWRQHDKGLHFDPRPEYDRPQANPTNLILVDARARGDYAVMRDQLDAGAYAWHPNEMREHAIRVLSRLVGR